jgi:hypothetical protein
MRLRSLDVARLTEKGDGFIIGSPIPNSVNADGPHWHPAIQVLFIRQNVAGLWLKYGATSAIIEAYSRRKNKLLDATIC